MPHHVLVFHGEGSPAAASVSLDTRGAPRPLPMRTPTGPGARLPVLLHASYAELGKSILNGKAAPGQPCALDKATPNSPWRPPGLTSQEALVCQELAAHLTGLALQVFVYEPNEECA